MNLLFGEYLAPTNPIASGIVTLLQYLFLLWSMGLIACGLWLFAKRIQICQNEDIQSLANARQEQDPQLEDNEQEKKADSAFDDFYSNRSRHNSTHVSATPQSDLPSRLG